MKRKDILAVALLVFLFAYLCSGARTAAEKKALFIAPTFNIQGAGISIDGIRQIGENLIKILEKRLGIQIEYEMVGSPDITQEEAMDLTLERLRAAGDFSWMDYAHYVKAREKGIPVEIVALVESGGSVMFNNCVYILDGTPFRTLEDLRGKRFNGGPNLDWVGIRTIMHEKGIDEPPDRFFADLIPMSTYFAELNGLLMKRIDAFVLPEPLFNILKNGNPNYTKIKPLACSKGSPNTLIPVCRKGTDESVVAAFRELLMNAHKDPDMGVVRPFIEAANVRFALPDRATLAEIDKLYKLITAKGWIDESKKYLADYRSVAKKKAAAKCKKNCAGATAGEIKSCIAKCDKKYSGKNCP